MVVLRLLLAGMAIGFASIAGAVTADQLRGGADDRNREANQRQSRANTGALGELLPQQKPVQSSKYGSQKPSTKAQTTPAKPVIQKAAPAEVDTNLYIPSHSAAASGDAGAATDAVKPSVAFGIRLGSWLQASLGRNTTSAESGAVELTLSTDAVGDRRTLPAGTTLFAEKQLNSATRRLELTITHGITPNGTEFEMRGIVFDPLKTPGLAGVYVMDKKEVASKGAFKGAIAAAGAAANSMGGGVAGAAANAASQSVLNDANQVAESNGVQAIIYVSPQPLIIRVEKQF